MEITLTHVAVGMALSIVGSVSMLWATWIRPAHRKEVDLQVRLAQIEAKMDEGERKMRALDSKDGEILDLLRSIDNRLRKLENSFAGVAPALNRELGQ